MKYLVSFYFQTLNNDMKKNELIDKILLCIELEGDGGNATFDDKEKEDMMRFLKSLKTKDKKFSFVSYDGKYPNLCRGVLKLKDEDGAIYTFGEVWREEPENNSYPGFWSSGGRICKGKDWDMWAEHGPWEFYLNEKCSFIEENKEQLIELFNENVSYGCCGGCI